MALRPRYFIRSDFSPFVNILSTTNEAFIFIGRTTTRQSGTMAGILLRSFLTIYPQILDSCDDLIVIRININRIDHFDLQGFGFGGGAFPHHGTIYFLRGGRLPDGPLLWKWSDTNFVRVEKTGAAEILNSFSLTSTLIKEEGWKKTQVRFNLGETITSIEIESGRCILTLKEDAVSKSLNVRGEGIDINEAVLAHVHSQSKEVSKRVYLEECVSK